MTTAATLSGSTDGRLSLYLAVLGVIAVWFVPLIITWLYDLPNKGAIAVLSLALGWTGVAWLAALVIAVVGAIRAPAPRRVAHNAALPTQMRRQRAEVPRQWEETPPQREATPFYRDDGPPPWEDSSFPPLPREDRSLPPLPRQDRSPYREERPSRRADRPPSRDDTLSHREERSTHRKEDSSAPLEDSPSHREGRPARAAGGRHQL